MGIELVVLDFDGTLTEVDKEAGPAVNGWRTDIGNELELSASEIERRWSGAQARIEADPSNYGWLMGDRIVAPAYADPLVMARTISDLLFDEAGVYMDRPEREDILQNRFFKRNYGKMCTVFKDGADEFLRELRDKFDVCIVTNSGMNGVEEKVAKLPTDHSDVPIHGGAKKYVLNPDWKDIPESVEKEGFGRPLFLRRQQYWNVLQQIMRQRVVTPERVAVVGDIYEMDLFLPEHQGMHVVLTPRNSTPKCEIDAVKSSPNGYVARNLKNALEHLESQR